MLNIPQLLAKELSLSPSQVQNALELFAEGATREQPFPLLLVIEKSVLGR